MPHRHACFTALLASAFLLFTALPSPAHAQALLEVVAAGDSSTAGGPTATSLVASTAGYTSTTTRVLSTAQGTRTGSFLDGIVSGSAKATSAFTVSGIADGAALTFTWALTGARTATADNHSYQNAYEFGFSDDAFYWVNWSIGYVDGPPFMGDFAGNLSAAPGISQAGLVDDFSLGFPPTWDGLGTIHATITRPMTTSTAGTFYQLTSIGLAGDISAASSIELLSVTVSDASFLTGPAFFALDSGLQIPITAVPEPSTYALFLGVTVLGWVAWRRRR